MLSPEENFKPLSSEGLLTVYMAEIRALERIVKTPVFNNILNHYGDYMSFLDSRSQLSSTTSYVSSLSEGSRIVEAANPSVEVQELLGTAHFGACSTLLEGAQLSLDVLCSKDFGMHMQEVLVSGTSNNAGQAKMISQRLVGMDAVRTIQLLRVAGLITTPSNKMFQLGLGAGTGNKDIIYTHMSPSISSYFAAQGQIIGFNTIRRQAAEIIISDLDPRYSDVYDYLERDKSISVTSFIGDAYDVLEQLEKKKIRKRNLVTMLRVEPAMIPDVDGLLRRLIPIVEDPCDLVMSVGVGDSSDAYRLRIDVMSDMFNRLEQAGLEPVLFRLHMGGDIMQQGSSLQYGNGATASYEILYCQLQSKVMHETFG